MKNNLLSVAVLALVLTAAPAAAVQLVFSDGFNSGNTEAWSNTVPPIPSNISVTFGDQSVEAPVGEDESMAILAIRFFIHNNDLESRGDIFVEKTWLRSLLPNLSSGFATAIQGSGGQEYTPGSLGVQMSAWCETFNRFLWAVEDDCPGDTDTHFAVDDDREFMVTVIFTNRPGGTTGSYRMVLGGFSYDHNGEDDNGNVVHTAGFPMQTSWVNVWNTNFPNLVPDAFPNKDQRRRLFNTGLEFEIKTIDGTATIVPLNL